MLQELAYEIAHSLLLAIQDSDRHKGGTQVEELAQVEFGSRLKLSSVAISVDMGTVFDIQIVVMVVQWI